MGTVVGSGGICLYSWYLGVGIGRSGVQDHPWLNTKLKANLNYVRPNLKKGKKNVSQSVIWRQQQIDLKGILSFQKLILSGQHLGRHLMPSSSLHRYLHTQASTPADSHFLIRHCTCSCYWMTWYLNGTQPAKGIFLFYLIPKWYLVNCISSNK